MSTATARYEIEHKSERLRAKSDALDSAVSTPGGLTPYGFIPGYVGHDAGEAEALCYMARRVLEGASLLTVARELEARGIGTKEGRAWHHSTVRAVLLNPAVAGLRIHRREVAGPASWAAIVDRDTWEQVRGVLADPARKRARPAQRYLLAGLVTNAAGAPMNGRPDRGRRTYSTRSGDDGPQVSIDADRLEDHVVTLVLAALDDAVVTAPPAADVGHGAVEQLEAELAELARLRGEGVRVAPGMVRGPRASPGPPRGCSDRGLDAAATLGTERPPRRPWSGQEGPADVGSRPGARL